MPATVGPQVPPRPARSPSTATAAAPSSLSEVLPRGSLKDSSRINTPNNYPRSPLFDPPSTQSLSRPVSTEVSDPTLPRRPPSVNLPSIGQEGSEYADISYAATEQDHSPALEQPGHVEKVVGDVKLHAPKPSLPEASAKAQVKTVTRTNDQQAAAHGFGKAGGYDHEEAGGSVMSPSLQPPSILGSTSQSSPPSSRRQSVALPEDEPTPAELGLRVPINPDAGAVQAPPPASHPSSTDHPYHHHHHHHHTSRKRHHARTPSGREASLPPGSYGLHGHGVHTHDKFDKDWYAKHPDQLAREEESVHGHYSAKGSGRGEWAMSHDDLNRIVRDTASRGAGLGTNEEVVGHPDEQIGFIASDEYSRVMADAGGENLQKTESNPVRPTGDSSSGNAVLPVPTPEHERPSMAGELGNTDEGQEESVIHVDDPAQHYNKVTGGQETMNETADLGPDGANTGQHGSYIDESGDGVPILASDEVAKSVGGEHMQPAIAPILEGGESHFHHGEDDGSTHITSPSRSISRPASTQGGNLSLSRFSSRLDEIEDTHTSLENVEEYEPLFPEDEENEQTPLDPAERFKRRQEAARHRFPSQDIWEDTPTSAMHVTTVSNVDAAMNKEAKRDKPASEVFEHPSVESARRGEIGEAAGKKVTAEQSGNHLGLDDGKDSRANKVQRFPSRDIWEDTPDSTRLVTTISTPSPPAEEASSPAHKIASRPVVPLRPANRSKAHEGIRSPPASTIGATGSALSESQVDGTKSPGTSEATTITTSLDKKQSLPGADRTAKPQIPPRPAKKDSLEALTKTTSGGTANNKDGLRSPPVLSKSKPMIPAKPGMNKANLPTSFMSDLNHRLQLGPQAPVKEKTAETLPESSSSKENVPLSDARKARTRGPQRRAPAKPSTNGELSKSSSPATAPLSSRLAITTTMSLWSINQQGSLVSGSSRTESPLQLQTQGSDISISQEADKKNEAESPVKQESAISTPVLQAPKGLAKNTAGEDVDPVGETIEASASVEDAESQKGIDSSSLPLPSQPGESSRDVEVEPDASLEGNNNGGKA